MEKVNPEAVQPTNEPKEEPKDAPNAEIEQPEGVDIPEVEEEAAEESEESKEEPRDEEPAKKDEAPKDEQPKSEERLIPVSALEAERKKWQSRLNDPELQKARAIAERLKQTTGKDYDALQRELDEMQIKRYTDEGIDPAVAQSIVYQQRKVEEMSRALKKQQRDVEIAELKQNPLYKDIELRRDEVETHADMKGMSLKAAYLDLYGDMLYSDMEKQIEQRILNNLQKKQDQRVNTSPTGAPKVQPRAKLTPDEEALAKAAGMTPGEYAAMKRISSVDQFQKFKSRK